MRGFLAVFEREIVERRLLAVAALALGLIPPLVPLLPGMPAVAPAELRNGVALSLALVLSFVFALLLGGSVVVRDIAERRLGFYFARPLPGGAIWAGKLAAAAALAAGAGLLVLLPTSLLGGIPDPSGSWGTTWVAFSRPEIAAVWLGALLLAVAVSHAAGVILRSRSPWLLVDLVALGATATVVWTCLKVLARDGAGIAGWGRFGPEATQHLTLLQYMEIAVGSAALLATAAAGAAQVIRGRTDLRRGHRALSLVLWSALLPASLGLAGYTRWFETPAPEDLVSVHGVVPSPAGSWIALYGQAAHRGGSRPGFLFDVGSGRFVRAGFGIPSLDRPSLVSFSADGGRAFWLEAPAGDAAGFRQRELELLSLDLRRRGASPQPTRVFVPGAPSAFALSPDGRFAAVAQNDRLTVTEIASGRLLASVRVADQYHERTVLAFSGPGRVRLYYIDSYWAPLAAHSHPTTFSIFELDVATGRLTATGRATETTASNLSWILSPSADRGLLRTPNALQLRDGATGALVATLGGEGARASFLPDGHIALLERSAAGSDLRILDAGSGAESRRFVFPGIRTVLVADQPAPDRVRAVTRGPEGTAPWQLWTLHLSTGQALPGPQLALTSLPFEGARPWPSRRGRDGIVWFDPRMARDLVVLRAGLPTR
ncbi:MAG TPA: hypothetical protein VIA62_26500 [Thermoanaerobaculia bacterium]|jgi:hypothetical protein|nr:hypothetical protein [Thermoanaerobaculia bacterium]